MILFLVAFWLTLQVASCENPRFGRPEVVNDEQTDRFKRQALINDWRPLKTNYKWPRGVVSYFIDKSFDVNAKDSLFRAMRKISEHTCIRFSDQEADISINITSQDERNCFAAIGRNVDAQVFNFQSTCWTVGSGIHELIHVLGFDHTHTRTDRDLYLNIDMEKLAESVGRGQISQYEIKLPQMIYVPYDLGSVMQYDPDGLEGFSPRDMDYWSTLGSDIPSYYDYLMINKYYQCVCRNGRQCHNYGYLNPANCARCNCPLGYGGVDCTERAEPGVTLEATTEWKTTKFSLEAGHAVLNGTDQWQRDYIYHFIWINAPEGKTIEVEIREHSGVECERGCKAGGIEVKTLEDPRMTSPRFCCADKKKTFKSKNSPTVVMAFNSHGTDEYTLAFRFTD